MLENLVTWVLNNYVGEYLENLNTDQLSIALLQGQVELENVPLKKEALRKFDIPLQVKSGLLGKLTLSVPLTRLRSEPWVVKMSDLLVLLGPPTSSRYAVEAVEVYEHTKKEQQLDELEKYHKKQLLAYCNLSDKNDAVQQSWWGASLVTTIVNNMQLILTNVHVRYEDDTTLPNRMPFSCGIRIQNISMQTTNSHWIVGFVQPSEGANMFKKLEIAGLSVYWNCGEETSKNVKSFKDLQFMMAPANKDTVCILYPFSAQLYMEKNTSKFPLKTYPYIPRFKFNLRPEKVLVEITKRQLSELGKLTKEWARFDRARQHRKWRPLVTIGENAKEWWNFAYNRVQEESRQRRMRSTWSFASKRAKQLISYCRAYRRRLLAYLDNAAAKLVPTTKQLVSHETTPRTSDKLNSRSERSDDVAQKSDDSTRKSSLSEDLVLMKQIERDPEYTYHELQLFRETVFRRIMAEKDTVRRSAESGTLSEEESFENIESLTPRTDSSRATLDEITNSEKSQAQQTTGGGLYHWLSGWIYGPSVSAETKETSVVEKKDELFDILNSEEKGNRLPPDLRALEKQFEDEILDVLHETRDDSTVFHRDTLLAEVKLKLEQMTIRLIDTCELSSDKGTRVLAMDLWELVSSVHFSPRRHNLTVSLTVGDMSLQRLCTRPVDESSAGNNTPDETTKQDGSLFVFGFDGVREMAQILFAIGKAKNHDAVPEREKAMPSSQTSLFQVVYRRRAPRLVVSHELNARFSELSVMYNEGAIDDVSSLFSSKSELNEVNVSDDGPRIEITRNVDCSIHLPQLKIELRSRRDTLLDRRKRSLASTPFALLEINFLSLRIRSKEQHLVKMEMEFGSAEVKDLFEGSGSVLISAGNQSIARKKQLSSSCPHLETIESLPDLTILPARSRGLSIPSPFSPRTGSDKSPGTGSVPRRMCSEFKDVGVTNASRFSFMFVDSNHAAFESLFKKVNYSLEIEVPALEVNFNRRTWVLLFDFVGFLDSKEKRHTSAKSASEQATESKTQLDELETKRFKLSAACPSVHVRMNYPGNKTRLGTVVANDVTASLQLILNDDEEPVTVGTSFRSCVITDETPFYSDLYSERLSIQPEDPKNRERTENVTSDGSPRFPRVNVEVVKCTSLKAADRRGWDAQVILQVPSAMSLAYVHTHRYFCSILDFWQQFVELIDMISRNNSTRSFQSTREQKPRIKLVMEVNCPAVISLPLNQHCNQTIIAETSRIKLSNRFDKASVVSDFKNYEIENYFDDDDYDCLVDFLKVVCSDIAFYEAARVMKGAGVSRELQGYERVCQNLFKNFYFIRSKVNVLSHLYELHVNTYRNLDLSISHKVPDVAIVTILESLGIKFTTEFYRLLRGFLELNLGETLVPIPETIPIEVLQRPYEACEVGSSSQYATFSFRILLNNVEFNCFTPCETPAKTFSPFGSVKLKRSRISFDACIDGQSELDLICDNLELVDSRYIGLDPEKRPNVFTTVLYPLPRKDATNRLMAEAHMIFKKDEAPVITLVLLHARVFLFLDWLNEAKNFLLLTTDFIPPDEDAYRPAEAQPGIFLRSASSPVVELKEQTIVLRVTLKESDLILLEMPDVAHSLALIARATAVLNLSDPHGILGVNLEIQQMKVDCCVMSSEAGSRCQLTNEFSMTIGLSSEAAQTLDRPSLTSLGLPTLSSVKHRLAIEVNELTARLSYKDVLVIRHVLESSLQRLFASLEKSIMSANNSSSKSDESLEISVVRTTLKSDKVSFWLLDDHQGTAFPVVRMILKKLSFDRYLDKTDGSLIIALDYFNQSVFGWEPLLEDWTVRQLTISKDDRTVLVDVIADERSTLDVNITQSFLQQAFRLSARWPEIKRSLNEDFRSCCMQSRSEHLPYILYNDTGAALRFTTAVDDVLECRSKQRKSSAKWHTVASDGIFNFEFPIRRLTNSDNVAGLRQLIVHVEGWDEISPVNVDAVGTYFRLAKQSTTKAARTDSGANVRIVVAVTMDKNGHKVVTIRSALTVVNHLPNPVLLVLTNDFDYTEERTIVRLNVKQTFHVSLRFANASMAVKPDICKVARAHQIPWREAKSAGEVVNKLLQFDTGLRDSCFWMCILIKREHYPEYELLSGHTILFLPPLTVLNLLPADLEFKSGDVTYATSSGKQTQITGINTGSDMCFEVATDRLCSVKKTFITRSSIVNKVGDTLRLHIRMKDVEKRFLDMYGTLSVGRGGNISLALWVPYWFVNKSGIPLIVKQEATEGVAAGQMAEHESAKDRNPLMFSFADDDCPKQCAIRIGNKFASDPGYRPSFGQKFPLTVGLHSMKLRLTHDHKPTLIYNIGVEVRQGTGRYKDTLVVMLTPRYILNNQTSYGLSLSHVDYIDQPKQHVRMASQCSLIWNENFEDNRMLCVKRDDVKYWSCPFRIDLISSFHVTMRDADETPQFLRVEVILNSAIFYVTFTDARFYPPPIQLENLSDVPVLYQQRVEQPKSNHLRTICKARSTVDYAWDDHYAPRLLTLQVFENKSNIYDPQKPGIGPPLVYTNDVYIKYSHSFRRPSRSEFTDELELALEVMQKGKVMLNKLNQNDSSCNQLWRFAADGCLENIGMNNRAKPGERYVLDVLDNGGYVLIMLKRNTARDRFQKWIYTPEKQLRCGVEGMFSEARRAEVVLATPNMKSQRTRDGVPQEQVWELQTQRPGSGVLDVECLHKGPTLVVRITDRMRPVKEYTQLVSFSGRDSSKLKANHIVNSSFDFEFNVSMRSGIGLSIINSLREELLYTRFSGIVFHVNRHNKTVQVTANVEVIQADNQLLSTDKWQVLFCQQDMTSDIGNSAPAIMVPALKLEMNCTPLEHYDAFDCLRLKLSDMSVQLDETLLWKIVQFVQRSEAAGSVQPDALLQPPNTELEKLDRVAARRCYFGTLDLEVGPVSLSVVTVANSGLSPELRKLKRQFNVKLVSFENAVISLPPFRQFRYFETFSFLIETLSKFYSGELKKQTFNIIVTMDAFGNPLGLASDLKESFEGLLFEGDLSGFVSGLGYGFTNSISKVASSMAHGVGALTFDRKHELMRRRMLRCQPQTDSSTALAHLYCGVKGLGVGVLGGLTAILTNTYNESRRDGLVGAVRGITTGAVDTVTKPVQGIFDLVEGTASAMKEMVGGGATRKSHFPDIRVRLPRVTSNLQSLLPPYSKDLAYAQMELLRINGYATVEVLLDVEILLDQWNKEDHVRQYALICSDQCYIIRQINAEPNSVVQRVPYKQLKQIQAVPVKDKTSAATIEVILEVQHGRRQRLPHIWCNRYDVGKRLCEKVSRAKQLYDHGKRTLAISEDYDVT